ncbi:MAG TPA: TadE family protein [Myxococcales bacterium]|nr:TadE family protein [Myxococcales bacterium]
MLRGEDGSTVVEAAILLPLMVFLILMTLQLALLQQARLMADYAAFAAARTGIVQSGNNGTDNGGTDGPMHDAAVFAVLPTFGRTDSFEQLAATAARFKVEDLALKGAGLSQIRVFILNPTADAFSKWGGHLNGQELDFDDVRPGATDATLLSLQVRYLYELRVPFANKVIQSLWMAAAGQSFNDGTPEGVKLPALRTAGALGKFYLPVEAFYTIRMQSNPFLKWAHP